MMREINVLHFLWENYLLDTYNNYIKVSEGYYSNDLSSYR